MSTEKLIKLAFKFGRLAALPSMILLGGCERQPSPVAGYMSVTYNDGQYNRDTALMRADFSNRVYQSVGECMINARIAYTSLLIAPRRPGSFHAQCRQGDFMDGVFVSFDRDGRVAVVPLTGNPAYTFQGHYPGTAVIRTAPR